MKVAHPLDPWLLIQRVAKFVSRLPALQWGRTLYSYSGLALGAVFLFPVSQGLRGEEPHAVVEVGSRRELFVDGFLVQELKGGAELRLHHPVPREVFQQANSWEGNMSTVGSTFRDGDRYRRYYNTGAVKVDPAAEGEESDSRHLCYEESDDGIHWRQPNLGLHKFQGSNANNIIFKGGPYREMKEISPMPTVFKDSNPAAPPDALYKAIFWSNAPKGMSPFKSPDGINWTPMSNLPIKIKVGASMNVAFWDSERSEYRAFFRSHVPVNSSSSAAEEDKSIDPPKGWRRDIRTATSKDFATWSEPLDLRYVDSPDEELYHSMLMPYARAPHIYIGFPGRYLERTWSDSMRALPDRSHRETRSRVNNRFGTGLTETLLMAGRDGVNFKRWNEAFLRPGIERSGTWSYAHQMIGWHPVQTKSALAGAPDELSFYVAENLWITNGRTIRRYTMRLDGFVSAHAPMAGGELVTKPMRINGRELSLNFATSAAGGVRVEIQDEQGKVLPGFALEDCPPMFGDSIERRVAWNKGVEVGELNGQVVRLRFVLKDADVFSFQFRP